MTAAFPVVTGLKVLKSYVYADVLLGHLPDQGRVSTSVRASVGDEEVAAAMRPLLDLLAKRAHSVVRTADLSEQIENGVREELKVVSENERSRIQRNSERQLEVTIRNLREAAGRAQEIHRTPIESAVAALEQLTGRG